MWETNNEPSRGAAITKHDKPETHYHVWIGRRFTPDAVIGETALLSRVTFLTYDSR